MSENKKNILGSADKGKSSTTVWCDVQSRYC